MRLMTRLRRAGRSSADSFPDGNRQKGRTYQKSNDWEKAFRDALMEAPLSRITMNPGICHGKPCIRGLRYPVEMLLDLLSAGMTIDEILADYEDLEREDLLAAIAFREA